MLAAVAFLFVLPTLVLSSGEGNIHLLEDEVATALLACTYNEKANPKRNNGNNHQRRSADHNYKNLYEYQVPRVDSGSKQDNDLNHYDHERRNSSEHTYVINGTENNIPTTGVNMSVKNLRATPVQSRNAYNYNNDSWTRSKRSDSLINKDPDQCLSQCVFANLEVVDARGIPREADLWNKVQTALTSQQSRALIKDQIHACFQELQPGSDDDGCSYSNKLERCLMLRFVDRKINTKKT